MIESLQTMCADLPNKNKMLQEQLDRANERGVALSTSLRDSQSLVENLSCQVTELKRFYSMERQVRKQLQAKLQVMHIIRSLMVETDVGTHDFPDRFETIKQFIISFMEPFYQVIACSSSVLCRKRVLIYLSLAMSVVPNGLRLLRPLATIIPSRTMTAVGAHYKVSNIPCFYDNKRKVVKPGAVRKCDLPENMSLKDRWWSSCVEDVFENYHTIIAFHCTYMPRINFENAIMSVIPNHGLRLLRPLATTSIIPPSRTMAAVGANYKVSNTPCFYDNKRKVVKPGAVRKCDLPENMSLKDRWWSSCVEDVFENYHTIIAFHCTYMPRINFEQKLNYELLDKLEGTSVQGNIFPRRIIISYLRRTPRFKHMIPLFQHRTGLLWTNDADEVVQICRALKETQFTKHLTLGGLVNGTLYGPTALMDTVGLNDKLSEQAALIGTLQAASGQELVQALSYNPAMLNLVLQSRCGEEGEEK
eukprot:sb/3464333/